MDPTELIDELIRREGGYVARAEDRGGPTRFGITRAVATAHGWHGPIVALPRTLAATIYRKDYWSRPALDRVAAIAPRIAEELFDTGANMGPATAAGFFRRALNALNRVGADYPDIATHGLIDDAAISALTAFLRMRGAGGETVLLRALDALQGERYLALAERRPADETFLYGWLANRIG